jgi:death-on-curing protein
VPPIFLTLDEVLEIHRDQIARYGGRPGVRDLGLLVSALAQPQATFGGQFVHVDLQQMAAAYLFHITANHPFIDGNKRVGAVAAIVFSRLNGSDLNATSAELESLVMGVAQSRVGKAEIERFIRDHAV